MTLTPHIRSTATPPPSADWYSRVAAWGEEANDIWGDCVFAGNAHIVEQQTSLGEGSEVTVTTAQVLAEYSRVTGFDPDAGPSGSNPTDNGARIQDGLDDLRRNGLAGRRIAAFARCDAGNHPEIQLALAELGCVDVGVRLPQSAMEQFNAGQPWEVLPADGGILGGHCVVAFGYDAQFVYLVTWGRVQPATWQWWDTYVDEAWAVVSPMWAGRDGKDPMGVDLRSLGAEFAALTGDPDPFPAPGLSPGKPAPSHPAVLTELISDLEQVIARAKAWIHILGT